MTEIESLVLFMQSRLGSIYKPPSNVGHA